MPECRGGNQSKRDGGRWDCSRFLDVETCAENDIYSYFSHPHQNACFVAFGVHQLLQFTPNHHKSIPNLALV
ncbi:MAG: hypothetical protein HFH74_00410 [Lachnospiraceae bacterium]|nr:hypothetical protein [Lachnospiraceae bacterium]